MPIECISRASYYHSEIPARMRPTAGTAGAEVPRMNAIFDGDGSPLIVTLSSGPAAECRAMPINIKDLSLGKRIAPRVKVRRKNHRTIGGNEWPSHSGVCLKKRTA
jgi:hypothetical protein